MDRAMDRHAEWLRIEAEAKEQGRAEIEALTRSSLEYGAHVAWVTTKRSGVVGGLSSVHRAGLPKGNVAYTTCDRPIADPALWLPLSPALIRTMSRCGFCEAAHAEHLREIAA